MKISLNKIAFFKVHRLVLFGVCRLKQVRLTFSQIKAWYRTVATFIAVGGVPTDTAMTFLLLLASLLLPASLLLHASQLWWPFSCCYWSYYRSCYGIIFQLLDYRDIKYRIGASRNYRTIGLRPKYIARSDSYKKLSVSQL
jgi:hypothetical protein